MVGADRRFGGWGGLSPGRSSWQSLSRELVVLAPPESLQPTTKQRPLLKAALPPSQVTKPAAISRGSKMQRLKNGPDAAHSIKKIGVVRLKDVLYVIQHPYYLQL